MADTLYCPRCDIALRPSARFCDQCGTLVSSAGMQTQRLNLPGQEPDWKYVNGYEVCIHRRADEWARNPALADAPLELAVCIEVEYRNETGDSQSVGLRHWELHDTFGFAYEGTLFSYVYLGREIQKLPDSLIMPGLRLRGWVGFRAVPDAIPDFIQFRPGYMSFETVRFPIESIPRIVHE